MIYKIENTFDINTFDFWSGAADRMNDATDEQKRQVEQRILDYFDDGETVPTDTQINDLVWFDCDDIFFPDENDDE